MADNDKLTEAHVLAKKAVLVREIELRMKIDSDKELVKYRLPHVRDRIWVELKWEDVQEKLVGIESAIYIIEQIDENADFQKTYNDFKKYKESENRKAEGEKRSCSRLNTPCPESVIFVGSCTGFRIGQMIKTHIGDVKPSHYRDTGGLHLKFWFKGEIKITVKDYTGYKEKKEYKDRTEYKEHKEHKEYKIKISFPVLRTIADIWANQLKPMFGRRGSENKKPSEKKKVKKKR